EPVDVVARGHGRHHLDGAAGQPERHGPQGGLARPVVELVHRRRDDVRVLEPPFDQAHSRAPFFQTYAYPTIRMPRKTTISMSPNIPMARIFTAHGNRKIVSTSNTTNSTAMT